MKPSGEIIQWICRSMCLYWALTCLTVIAFPGESEARTICTVFAFVAQGAAFPLKKSP